MGGAILPVLKFIGAIFVGTTAAGFTAAGAGLILAVNLARVGLLALVAKLTSPKLDLSAVAQQKSVTVRNPIAPQRFVYGEDMLSGPIIFANTAGTDNRDLYFLIALTGHEIDSYQAFRIDSLDIPLTDLSGAEDGDVNGGDYDGVARVDVRHGTSAQAVISSLTTNFGSLFGANHTGRGWSYMLWEFNLVEGSEDVFKNQPQNMRALIRGYQVYDPRLDSTVPGGSGAHRVDDPATWEWSHNPALCLGHFIIDTKFGMAEETDRVDWEMVQTAADICDEAVAIPTASTQDRYTCNVTFDSTMTRSTVRDELLGSMLGRMVFSQGLWKIWAGDPITPDVTLTEANLAGGITLEASTPSRDRYNRVRGKYIDAAKDYTAASYPEARSSVYVTEDGDEILPIVADFTSCNNFFEAQRKSIITLKQSRNQRVVIFEGNYSCFRIQPGSTVLLTIDEYGFSGEKFFVTEWKLSASGVVLTMVEEVDSVWTEPIEGDYATRSATGTLTFTDTGVPAPTSASATSEIGGVQLNWTNPPTTMFDVIEVWASDDNVRGNATIIATVNADEHFDQVSDGRTRFYWFRARNIFGQVSAYLPDLSTTTITTNAVLDPGKTSVPSFAPGLVGGSSDFVYILNEDHLSVADDGDLHINGSEFNHPDGTAVTPDVADWALSTFYEGSEIGRFYVMYSATIAETRFGGSATDWGTGDDTRFCCVTWDSVNLWRARNDSGTYFSFTPIATDCIIAICDKLTTGGGIETVTPVTGGAGGGGDGLSVHVANVYQRAASQPATPSVDDGQYNFTTLVLTPPSGWSVEPPSVDGNPLWVSTGSFSIVGDTGTDTTVTWTSPNELVDDGVDGSDGDSVYVALIYLRASSAPATPTADSGQYNFTTNVLTPASAPVQWFVEPPAGSDPLYVSVGSFSINGPTGIDTTVTWTAPDLLVQDGADGAAGGDGASIHVANIYVRSASAPATPTADSGQYNFTTNVLTPASAPIQWFVEPPASDGNPLYVSTGSFDIVGISGTDTTVTWTAPDLLVQDGDDGAVGNDGDDGLSVYIANVYQRASSPPATPSVDDGQYNFTTSTLTPPSGWTEAVPAADGNPLYVSHGPFEIQGPTGTDTTVTWTAPTVLAQDGDDAIFYYIKPINGTAIQNGSGTLTVEAHRVTGGADILLSTGTIQLFEGATLVTVANGYAAGSDGYTGVLDSGDITGSAIIELKDGSGGTVLDSITLVDVADGADGLEGVFGYIEPENGLAWTQAINGGAWTPSQLTTDLDVTFVQGGSEVARISRRITLTSGTGFLASSVTTHPGGDLNTGRVTVNVSGGGSQAITVSFDYSFSGDETSVAETVKSVIGGTDGADALFYYIKPTTGTAIQNSSGTLTVEAHEVTGGSDILLSTGTIQLFEGATLITVANGYAAGSDGYTGVFDSGDISGDAIVELKDGSGGTILDTVTLVDVTDGADGLEGVFGYVEPENGLAWTQAINGGAWTPSQLTTDLDVTFVQGGSEVARISRRITLTSGTGFLASSSTTHPGGDLNTGRVTPTVSGGGTQAITVSFAYSFSGDETTVAETVKSVIGGQDGQSVHVANIYLRASSAPATPTADSGEYNFTTNVLTPASAPVQWFVEPPVGTDPLYVSTGSFSIIGDTGIDTTVTWTSPNELVSDGTDGDSVYVANVYQRALNAPATPSVDDGEYNFTTNVLTPPSGWATVQPEGTEPLWVSTGSFSISGPTGTDTTVTWTDPDLLVTDGEGGSNALNTGRRFGDLRKWYTSHSQVTPITNDPPGIWTSVNISSAPIWPTSLRGVDDDDATENIFSERMPCDPDKTYRISVDGQQPSGARTNYLLVAFYDSAGDNILGSGAGALGWLATGTYFYWGRNAQVFPTTWTNYSLVFGPGGSGPLIPSGAEAMAIGGLFLRTGAGETTLELNDYHIVELTDAITTQLTNSNHSLTSGPFGLDYDLTGSGGTHNVFNAGVDVTTDATHAVEGTATKNGLTMSVVSGTGVYSLSGTSWDSDLETFTLRATYLGNTFDQVYTISKAKQGADNLIMHSRDWVLGAATDMGRWNLEAGSLDEVDLVNDVAGPFNEFPFVMELRGDGATNPGWYAKYDWHWTYDEEKSYIFYMWVERVGAGTTTGLYCGFWDGGGTAHVKNANTDALDTNPYFLTNLASQVDLDKWYLTVGVIYPDGYTGGDQGVGGIYDPATGLNVKNQAEFYWNGAQNNNETLFRFGMNDASAPPQGTSDGFNVTRPLGFIRDGSEPTVEEMLAISQKLTVVTSLTQPAATVTSDADGFGYSLTNAGGTHEVYRGTNDITTDATHSVQGGATKNGLTLAVGSGTGVYSLSGASWTTETEFFTLRAVFDGLTFDKVYNITKIRGNPANRIFAIGGGFVDIAIDPDDAEVEYQIDADGDVYEAIGLGASLVSIGTWLGSGVAGDYDVFMEDLGTGFGSSPTGAALDTWLAASTDRNWRYLETAVAGNGSRLEATIRWRDDTTFEELGAASVNMEVDVDV